MDILAVINTCPNGSEFAGLCLSQDSITHILQTILPFVYVIAILLTLVNILWGGFRMILSMGKKEAFDSARSHIFHAIIGLIMVFLSYFILSIVVHFFLPGLNLNALELPQL